MQNKYIKPTKLNFSIFILQFNFFNEFTTTEKDELLESPHLPNLQHFQQASRRGWRTGNSKS